MGALSFDYGRLIGTFHLCIPWGNREARYYKALTDKCQVYFTILPVDKFELAM